MDEVKYYNLEKKLFLEATKNYLEKVQYFLDEIKEKESYTSIVEIEALERLEDDLQDTLCWFN